LGLLLTTLGNVDAQVAAAQAAARKPVMSKEQVDGGGQVKWVGSSDGNWQVLCQLVLLLLQ
jgi:hypothetical protein